MTKDPVKELQARIRLQKTLEARVKRFLRQKKTWPLVRKAKGREGSITVQMPCSLKWLCDKHGIAYENFMRLKKMSHIGDMETLQRIDAVLKAEGV